MKNTKHLREHVLVLPCDYGEADGWGLRVLSPSEDGEQTAREVICLGCCEHAARAIAPRVQAWLKEGSTSSTINIAAGRERLLGYCGGLIEGLGWEDQYCPDCDVELRA